MSITNEPLSERICLINIRGRLDHNQPHKQTQSAEHRPEQHPGFGKTPTAVQMTEADYQDYDPL